ncbi:DUF4113 domain-containing protein, partial [Escherichia coli]
AALELLNCKIILTLRTSRGAYQEREAKDGLNETVTGIAQPGLFDEIQPYKNSEKLMKTLDELNLSGKGKVWFAGRGTAPKWQMKREMLSQCYTTKWRDIPLARLG